ncbi:hypothetical protein F0562_025054 [Nyssa sinensis]|uniref:Uncharacterized protein n=1 Tax=Nyssa sinensis TaxID=561372 RepID=A0A5J5BIX9_9ASTE|nr:hypothetical protein F0562_025054 [Nyssa sinensis]
MTMEAMETSVKFIVAPLEQVGAIAKLVQVPESKVGHEENPVENAHVQPRITLSDCVIEIGKKLDEALLQEGCHSIFEVPSSLQKLEPDEFIPQVVSVGPYHRNAKPLRPSSICMSSQANYEDKQLRHDVLDLARPRSSKYSSSQVNCEDKQLQHDVLDLALPPFSRCTSTRAIWEDKQPFQIVVRSVTSLRGANVEFRKKDSTNIIDIEFNQGVLNIPPFVIHDFTKSIFLNLMVFEQYFHRRRSNYVTSYIRFMDGLINSSNDVEHLCDKRIIVHGLGSNDNVANLFNNLWKYIVNHANDSNLTKVSQDLTKHFNRHVKPGATLWDFMVEIDKTKLDEVLPQ